MITKKYKETLDNLVEYQKRWVTVDGRHILIGSSGGGGGGKGGGGGSSGKTFRSEEAINEWAGKNTTEWQNSLTEAQKQAIYNYTGTPAYGQINAYLRGKSDSWKDDRNPTTVKNLDDAIDSYTLPETIITWRGTNGELFEGMDIGDSFIDKGYASTSLSKSVATIYADAYDGASPAIMRVINKKGSNGAYVSNLSRFPNEREFVMPRGTKMKLVSITQDEDSGYPIYVFEAEK